MINNNGMKKNLFFGVVIVALSAVTFFNTEYKGKILLSEMVLSNVEALAECENKTVNNGGIITVTVCDRVNNPADVLINNKYCTLVEVSKTCTYTK
ncbi:MAG: hypothetical protein GX638_07455 [Crenarchaeota archaeon]|nr:hypothetical protein [Thermoproteota archaeon]